MSKIIKAKIYYTKTEGGTSYSGGYPIGLTDTKTQWLVESDETEKGQDEKGTYVTKLAVVYDNTLVDKAIATGQCWEINEIEADEFGKKFSSPQVEQITDQEKVIKICAKAIKGEVLTQKEKNAIDPDNEEIGINKTKPFDIKKYLPKDIIK